MKTAKSQLELLIPDAAAMHALGLEIGRKAEAPLIILLRGELGAGKTTLVKGIAEACGVDPASVTSPTFTLHNHFCGEPEFNHFDLYRLGDPTDFIDLGFFDFVEQYAISCIEWPERIEGIDLPGARSISIEHHPNGGRMVVMDDDLK